MRVYLKSCVLYSDKVFKACQLMSSSSIAGTDGICADLRRAPAEAALLVDAGSFSIIKQSMALNCFPRVTIRNKSNLVGGQIYIEGAFEQNSPWSTPPFAPPNGIHEFCGQCLLSRIPSSLCHFRASWQGLHGDGQL